MAPRETIRATRQRPSPVSPGEMLQACIATGFVEPRTGPDGSTRYVLTPAGQALLEEDA